jgi:pimeloyl-ACP methyl ester carboxylesterase
MDTANGQSNGKRLLPVGDVTLCVETFGEQRDPALLLIAGTSGPMDGWDAGFCQLLATGGRYVIRYDNRDTGQSTSYPPGEPPYEFDDFVDDAIGLLDALGVGKFHVAGGSLGGAVARALALSQPTRVQSLTLLSSTPLAPGDPRDPTLPPPTPEFLTFAGAERPAPDWGDRQAYIDNYALWDRQYAGAAYFDEDEARAYAGRVYDRTVDIHAASINHSSAGRGSTPKSLNLCWSSMAPRTRSSHSGTPRYWSRSYPTPSCSRCPASATNCSRATFGPWLRQPCSITPSRRRLADDSPA